MIPNSASLGFSGSMYGPMTIASAQGTGYSYTNKWTDTTATAVNAAGETVNAITVSDLYDPAL